MTLFATTKTEYLTALTAFSEPIPHEQLLPELLKLQEQAVSLVFGEGNAQDKTFKDIAYHLKPKCKASGIISPKKWRSFQDSCFALSNHICALKSGLQGEKILSEKASQIAEHGIFIPNVELEAEGESAAINGVYVAGQKLFLIEATNISKNVYISRDGSLYLDGTRQQRLYNAAENARKNERLMTKILHDNGIYDRSLMSMLVFTNPAIRTYNDCPFLFACFADMLPGKIHYFNKEPCYSEDEVFPIRDIIQQNSIHKSYTYPQFRIDDFKSSFTEIVAALEEPIGFCCQEDYA